MLGHKLDALSSGTTSPDSTPTFLGTNAPARQPLTRRENVSTLGLHHVLTLDTLFNLRSATNSLGASRWENRREVGDRAHWLSEENLSLIEVVICQLRT